MLMYTIAVIVIMLCITLKKEVSKWFYVNEAAKNKEKLFELLSLTWPVSSGGTWSVSTCLAYRSKYSLPATSSIAPILRL